jgi:hypothetical protein
MVIIDDPSVTVNCRTAMKVLCLNINCCISEKIDSLSHSCRSKSLLYYFRWSICIFRMTLETVANISVANTVSTTVTDKMVQPPSSDKSSSRPNNSVNMYTKLYENEWTDTLDTLTQSGKRWAMDLVIKHLYIVLNVI